MKSAYGLTEALRLWYLKASRDIATTPLVELPIAKATYAAADEKGTWALLNLHVDDGLLMGSDDDPRFVALRRRFDELFNIKSWKQIPMTFLGVDLVRENGLLMDTMESYIENIQTPKLEAKDPQAALVGRDLTCYRQLIMRLRWPAAHVANHATALVRNFKPCPASEPGDGEGLGRCCEALLQDEGGSEAREGEATLSQDQR